NDVNAADFTSLWPESIERAWAGPEYWTNPLPDWRVRSGRLECYRSGGDRNVYLLTRELGAQKGILEMSVTSGQLDPDNLKLTEGWVGFKIGSRGEFNDYRDSAVRGDGLNVGMDTEGRLFIGGFDTGAERIEGPFNWIKLSIKAEPSGDRYKVTLNAYDKEGAKLAELVRKKVHKSRLTGSLALVCSAVRSEEVDLSKQRHISRTNPNKARGGVSSGGNVCFWFSDWKVSGSKVAAYEERAWGPVLFAQHTLSRKVLKLTAQMAPVGNGCRVVELQVQGSGAGGAAADRWRTIGEAVIDPLARTAAFRISNWDDTSDTPYRVAYPLVSADGGSVDHYFTGTIRKNPTDKEEIVVAAFTGNNDFGFPHTDVVEHVRCHNSDLLVFTGDQIYERTGGYQTLRIRDVRLSSLDYLRRWYIYGWEYRELLRDIPSVCLPDDHDVFQGNIWGAGGRPADISDGYGTGQDNGGYCMPAVWVNMVERTQTSHMPDPYDPTPLEHGISVYYCPMNYGGVSFAVVEDRKWKSSPKEMLPEGIVINGWVQKPGFNSATEGDVAGAVLLGQRQLDFLGHWAADWSAGAWMKVVISQTIFANLATLPPPANADNSTPQLKVMKPGEYAEGEVIVQDHDSNGWPQTGRNKALKEMRRGFALHIAGDQHLGSTVQYGVDDWHDAGFAVCVPAVANVWPRRWFPPEPGRNRRPGRPRYTGDYKDGFGNKITVHAVSNPHENGIEPTWINHRAPGYGIITFNRNTRKIEIANWPRWVDPSKPDAGPYPGWPVVIDQTDNYNRKAAAWLPTFEVSGMDDPVVQVVDESNGEIVYTLRIKGKSFRPKVFGKGLYTLKVGEPGTDKLKVLEHIESCPESAEKTVRVEL
ncbi:MAG: alkaline phosphatase D family protein, partial [Gemmatimonadota bacterium]|nr:alkaline phosphatase D family protein [Gemmatimonadota bacterium]